jgi:hypothetical protein
VGKPQKKKIKFYAEQNDYLLSRCFVLCFNARVLFSRFLAVGGK